MEIPEIEYEILVARGRLEVVPARLVQFYRDEWATLVHEWRSRRKLAVVR